MAATRHWKKIYTLITAVIVFIAVYVFYRVKKHDFLDNKLQELVNDKTNRLYKLTYDSIHVNEATGNLFIRNLRLQGDTAKQMEMIGKGDTNAAKIILDVFIPELRVAKFKTASALLSKQMECDTIFIAGPRVSVFVFPGVKSAPDPRKQQEQLYKQILGNFKLIRARNVLVTNGQVTAVDFFTREKKFQGYNTSINLADVAIDSTYNADTSRTLFCKEITITSEKVVLGDKKNTAEIVKAAFDTRSKILSLGSFEYDAYKNNGFFKAKVDGISLHGISWTGPVENSDLVIDKAIFTKGEIDALAGTSSDNKKKGNEAILTGWIKSFTLGSLQVKSVDYKSRPVDSKEKPFTLKNNSFFIRNVHINRESKLDESLVRQAKEVELSNDEILITSKDNRYNFRFIGLRLNSKTRRLTAKKIMVIPRLSEPDFARIARYQTDRYDIDFLNLVCENVDIGKLVKGEISIDKITTTNSKVMVFRDMSYPIDSVSKRAASETFPHQLLHKLSLRVLIKRFTAGNLFLEYKEKNPASQNSGKVRFVNSTLVVNNISNHPAKAGERMIARFSTLFLNEIPMTGGFTFYLDEWQKGKFIAEAYLNKSFDAKILNQLTEPMSMARIDKGTFKSTSFKTVADTGTSNGHLEMSYEDLKISLLKKKGDAYAKKDLLSFFANILVKNKNKAGSEMRTADVTVDRNKYKSFFNFIWMTVFKGMRQTLTIKI
jgi:hypothetical protein